MLQKIRLDRSRGTCELIVLHVPQPPRKSLALNKQSRCQTQTQLGAELAKFNTNSDLTLRPLWDAYRVTKKHPKNVLRLLIHMRILANTGQKRWASHLEVSHGLSATGSQKH